jgi:hypothetical protein
MIEWQQLGNKFLRHELNATILPERLLISDLLECTSGHYEVISSEELPTDIKDMRL